MTRSPGLVRSKRRSRLCLESLGDRTLLSVTTCTLTNGVLQATFCNGDDVVEVDADPAARSIQVLINNQPNSFPAAEVQSLRISSLHLNDVVLLDTTLRLPLLLDGTVQGNDVSGWVAINPRAVVHQHNPNANLFHWVINTYNYGNFWSIAYPVSLTPESQSSSSGDTLESQFTRIASSLSLASFSAASSSLAQLGGHLFHYLGGTPGGGVGTTADMTSGHDGGSPPMSSEMQSSLGGAAHETLMNPPATVVEHKPG